MKTIKEPEDILGRETLKTNPFGVPQGYFANMKQEVMDKIAASTVAEEDMAPAEPATFITYLKPALSLAAVFAMVFGIGYGAMKITGTYTDDAAEQVPVLSEVYTETSTGLTEEEMISILDICMDDIIADQGEDEEEIALYINNEDIEEYLIENRISSIQIAMLEQN